MILDNYLRQQYQELGIKLFWDQLLIEEGYLEPESYKIILKQLENRELILQIVSIYCPEGHICWQGHKDEYEKLKNNSYDCQYCSHDTWFEIDDGNIRHHFEITRKLIDDWNELDDFWCDYNIKEYEYLSGKKFTPKTYKKNFS